MIVRIAVERPRGHGDSDHLVVVRQGKRRNDGADDAVIEGHVGRVHGRRIQRLVVLELDGRVQRHAGLAVLGIARDKVRPRDRRAWPGREIPGIGGPGRLVVQRVAVHVEQGVVDEDLDRGPGGKGIRRRELDRRAAAQQLRRPRHRHPVRRDMHRARHGARLQCLVGVESDDRVHRNLRRPIRGPLLGQHNRRPGRADRRGGGEGAGEGNQRVAVEVLHGVRGDDGDRRAGR